MSAASHAERLQEAIALILDDQREAAQRLLREIIREDNNNEAAWLWMSVAVDSLDASAVCLDNALRVNSHNAVAAGALYRIRAPDMQLQRWRQRLTMLHGLAAAMMWVLVLGVLCSATVSFALLAAAAS